MMLFDIFIMTDQPETCRKCGTRTDFTTMKSGLQFHRCPNCLYTYILEDDIVPCIKCASKNIMEDIIDDIPVFICITCKTFFCRDDLTLLEHINSSAYFGE